jgi:hypothetical protein
MSHGKRSQVDDVTKLRKILDNPSDSTLNALISKDEMLLESVRRRLKGDSLKTLMRTHTFPQRNSSLEPRVVVRPKIVSTPRLMTTRPAYEPTTSLPEFTFVSSSSTEASTSTEEIKQINEELFEVEHVKRINPDFIEVISKEQHGTLNDASSVISDQAQIESTALPEWQPIQNTQSADAIEPDEQRAGENIQEFDQPNNTMMVHNGDDKRYTEAYPLNEVSSKPPVEFLPIEPQEPLLTEFSKRQIREAKKEQKKKDREAKRLKKLERQKIKIEQREKEKARKQSLFEESLSTQSQDEPESNEETQPNMEIPYNAIEYNAFKGMSSIDEKTAELLYKNGYFSIDNLREATIDDLVQIRGIKRKLAKQIKKEIEQSTKETEIDDSEFITAKPRKAKKKVHTAPKDTTEWELYPVKSHGKKESTNTPFIYNGYTLYRLKTNEHRGKQKTIHFFSKKKPHNGQITKLPEGYKTAVNKKTGIPYLKKKR